MNHRIGHRRRVVAVLSLVGAMAACQTTDQGPAGTFSYPSLHSVPASPRPSASIDQRRDIVRGLIEDRNESLRHTQVVRGRSGLAPPVASADPGWKADTIVPDAPAGQQDPFRLREGGAVEADSVYRSDTRFEDGGLDDFIRDLKRDTSPPAPETDEGEASDAGDEAGDENVSALDPQFRKVSARPRSFRRPPTRSGHVLVASFAPAIGAEPGYPAGSMIRLAANGEDAGFFCNWLGWTVAWSSVCLDGADTSEGDEGEQADDDVAADTRSSDEGLTTEEVERALDGADEDNPGSDARSSSNRSGSGDDSERLTEEEVERALEGADGGILEPVERSLEKLRDFTRERTGRLETVSPRVRRPTPGDEAVAASVNLPPQPKHRPKRRLDVALEDRGETFLFRRTPVPALKPTQVASQDPVILPPATPAPTTPAPTTTEFRPRAKPPAPVPEVPVSEVESVGDETLAALTDGEDAREGLGEQEPANVEPPNETVDLALDTEADEPEPAAPVRSPEAERLPERPTVAIPRTVAPAVIEPSAPPPSGEQQAAIDRSGSAFDEPGLSDAPYIIDFEPNSSSFPDDTKLRLIAVLAKAKAYDQKIHIIGEASTGHLARARATEVGAALVRLGATVEILEYDHDAIAGVDRVRLVLSPAESLQPSEGGASRGAG